MSDDAMRSALEEMLSAFVPTMRSEFRLTQAQGGAVSNARAALAKATGAKIIEFPSSDFEGGPK